MEVKVILMGRGTESQWCEVMREGKKEGRRGNRHSGRAACWSPDTSSCEVLREGKKICLMFKVLLFVMESYYIRDKAY